MYLYLLCTHVHMRACRRGLLRNVAWQAMFNYGSRGLILMNVVRYRYNGLHVDIHREKNRVPDLGF